MPLSVEEIQRKIIAEARRQGLDPALALGLAQAESSFNPNAVGDNGKSIGLFQLQPAAAHDVGMRPEERYDVDKNIAGGLKYLRNRLRREGDEDRGISAYNQGTGMRGGQLSNPQYVRTVRQYQRELQPVVAHASTSLLSRVRGAVTPARAEAAETGGLAPGQARPGAADPRDALGERLFGPKPTAPAAAPPAEGATVTAPADPRDALGERLFGPKPTAPAETFPPLAEQEAAATQQALSGRPAAPTAQTQVDLLRQQEAGRLKAEREVGSPTVPASLPVGSQVRGGVKNFFAPIPPEQLGPTTQAVAETIPGFEFLGFLPKETQERLVAATPEAARTAASVGVQTGLTAAGTALGGPVGTVFGSGLGYAAAVGLGLEEYSPLGAGLAVVVPGMQAIPAVSKKALQKVVQSSRGWKAVEQADEANVAAKKVYQEGVEAAEQQTKAQRQAALGSQQQRETAYQERVQRQRTTAETRHQTQEAQRAQTVAERQAVAVQEAEDLTQKHAREYAEQVQRYDQAVASQRQAVGQARAIPPRYTPETPSHVVYKKVAEIAPEAPVTLARTQEVAAELQDVLSQVPSLQPSRMQALLTDMRAARSTQSVREVQRYLTDLGTLTRSPDSATRRTAKQLYGALHDDLAESAQRLPATEAARELLLQANATFRREMATQDLSGVIRRALTVGDDGIPRLAPGRALTQFDRLVEGDRFFAGSFTPDELTQLRGDLAGLTTAQKIPARPGAAPAPVTPKAVEPFTPTPFQPPQPPARPAPYTSWKPDVPGPKALEPVLPKLETREMQDAMLKGLRSIGWLDALVGGVSPIGGTALVLGSKNAIADGMAQLIINPKTRPFMQRILNLDGSINKEALITLAGGRAALMAERKKEREEKQGRR